MSRINESIRLFTNLPGYEDIFAHFRDEYAARVMQCPEEDMVNERRRYTWLDELKTEIDNFNCENSHE